MNKTLLILPFTAMLLIGSNRVNPESHKQRPIEIDVQDIDHELERLRIEANCERNESSKSKQDFIIFTENMTAKEKMAAKKLVE